jgi:hypothetical protein
LIIAPAPPEPPVPPSVADAPPPPPTTVAATAQTPSGTVADIVTGVVWLKLAALEAGSAVACLGAIVTANKQLMPMPNQLGIAVFCLRCQIAVIVWDDTVSPGVKIQSKDLIWERKDFIDVRGKITTSRKFNDEIQFYCWSSNFTLKSTTGEDVF